MRRNRVAWIDIVRAIGIFFIVLGHIPEDGLIRKYIFSFHVPLFFLISGLCFDGHESFGKFITKKIKTIVIPYFVFSIMSIVIFTLAGYIVPSITQGVNTNVLFNIKVMLYGNSKPSLMKYNLPLWFLPCLFSATLFIYVIEKTLQKVKNRKTVRYLWIVLLATVGGLYSSYASHIYLPWHMETAVQMSVFYLLGIQIRESATWYFSEQAKHTMKIAAGLFTVVALLLGVYGSQINHIIGVRNDSYGNLILYYLVAMCNCFAWIQISRYMKHNRVLEYIGKNTLSILALHKFPIMLIVTILGSSKLVTIDNLISFISACMISIVTIGLCLVGNLIILHICPVAVGKQAKSQKRI